MSWDGTDQRGMAVESGIYLCVLRLGIFHDMKKLVLLK
jgi:hypothetical protein